MQTIFPPMQTIFPPHDEFIIKHQSWSESKTIWRPDSVPESQNQQQKHEKLTSMQRFNKSIPDFELQKNLCKMATLKMTENWFSRPIIA